MALHAELLEDIDALERLGGPWDALALARGRPYCTPGWMLAWLREVAPADALIRACAVHDGGELVGLAPFWTTREGGRYGLLAERTSSPVEPLAAGGREQEVATAVAAILAGAEPRPRELELIGHPGGSGWPLLLAEAWSWSVERTRVEALPAVSLDAEDAEAWLASRSRNLRQQLRRGRRQLDSAGARLRVSAGAERERDLAAFARLHHARWRRWGGSRALDPAVEAMLRTAGSALGDERFRLLTLEVDGEAISSHLFVRGGGVLAYWLGGFDERWAACKPSLQVLASAVQDGIEHGDRVLELGPGGQDYKYRLADGGGELEWLTLRPAGV